MNLLKLRQFSSTLGVRNINKAEWIRLKKQGRKRLVDLKKIRVCGGKGGDGAVSFKNPSSNKVHVGGPDGGDGGDGGGVVFIADASVKSLRSLLGHYRGKDGKSGQGSFNRGNSGKDVVIKVPPGTLIRDCSSSAREILHDLLTPGSSCLIAQGGEGGLGNARFSTTVDRKPTDGTPGLQGEERLLEVELRTIADVGLVGFPNAGKSTLLRALSRAKPKVGDYPFTTISPEIGVVKWEGPEDKEGGGQVTVADIPGLVPDAHLNKGLGHAFLRHVQRCSALILVLDGSDRQTDMSAQLGHLQRELELYDEDLPGKAHLIVANKMDVHYHDRTGCGLSLMDMGFEEVVRELHKEAGLPVVPISGLKKWNIGPLREALFRITKQLDLLER